MQGNDVSAVRILDVLKTLIEGFKKEPMNNYGKRTGNLTLEVSDTSCDVKTGRFAKKEIIQALQSLQTALARDMVNEAKRMLNTEDLTQIEKYLEDVFAQGRAHSNKLN
jgi:hypothetical protein